MLDFNRRGTVHHVTFLVSSVLGYEHACGVSFEACAHGLFNILTGSWDVRVRSMLFIRVFQFHSMRKMVLQVINTQLLLELDLIDLLNEHTRAEEEFNFIIVLITTFILSIRL